MSDNTFSLSVGSSLIISNGTNGKAEHLNSVMSMGNVLNADEILRGNWTLSEGITRPFSVIKFGAE